jgi:hypothetical protein
MEKIGLSRSLRSTPQARRRRNWSVRPAVEKSRAANTSGDTAVVACDKQRKCSPTREPWLRLLMISHGPMRHFREERVRGLATPSAGVASALPVSPRSWPSAVRHDPASLVCAHQDLASVHCIRLSFDLRCLAWASVVAWTERHHPRVHRSRGGPEPRPGKGPVQRRRLLARAFPLLGRPQSALEASRALPHGLRSAFEEQKRRSFLRLAREVALHGDEYIVAGDWPGVSKRPALGALRPLGAVRRDQP